MRRALHLTRNNVFRGTLIPSKVLMTVLDVETCIFHPLHLVGAVQPLVAEMPLEMGKLVNMAVDRITEALAQF